MNKRSAYEDGLGLDIALKAKTLVQVNKIKKDALTGVYVLAGSLAVLAGAIIYKGRRGR